MRRLALALIVLALPAHADSCPPVPDRSDALDAIFEDLQAAETPAEGQRLSNALWEIWTDAPDARAQELLDHGMARREVYDYAGAVEAFDALVAYCPHWAEGYNQRAFIAFLRQDYGTALDDLERALERNPEHVGALSGLALTLLHLGRIDAGQSVLRDALELNPWLPERGYLIEEPGEEL